MSGKNDTQPFSKKRPQVSAFIGSYMRDIGPATEYAFEYPFYGDFAAGLIVGDKAAKRFRVVEFEDGRNDSVSKTPKGRSTAERSRRSEHGFSQIVDWFTLIDDIKKTSRFQMEWHLRLNTGH